MGATKGERWSAQNWKKAISGAAAVALIPLASTSPAHAQVITADAEPAPALVFEQPELLRPATRETLAFIDVFSNLRWSSNALSVSNFSSGLNLRSEDDIFWQKGISGVVARQISPSATVFARAELSHVDFVQFSQLDYVSLSGLVGASANLGPAVAYLSFECSSERADNNLREYYRACGPRGGLAVVAGDPYTGTGAEFGMNAFASLGKKLNFARYREIGGYVRLETGTKVRVRLRPSASIRYYSTPEILSFGEGNRRDYSVTAEAALLYRTGRFELGLTAEPRLNWSNFREYRHWDFRVGPTMRARFGL